jgi:hypothetical protein
MRDPDAVNPGRKIADGLDANGICFEWRTHEITSQDILNDGNVEG